MTNWISIADRLPDLPGIYKIFSGEGMLEGIGIFDGCELFGSYYGIDLANCAEFLDDSPLVILHLPPITHWAPNDP